MVGRCDEESARRSALVLCSLLKVSLLSILQVVETIQAKFAEFKHDNHIDDNKRVATGFGVQSRYRVDCNQSL